MYGVGPLDNEDEGVVFHMKAGDIAVHAAGVSHRNVESEGDYTYMVSCWIHDLPRNEMISTIVLSLTTHNCMIGSLSKGRIYSKRC